MVDKVPSWVKYRKVDLNHELKPTFDLNAPSTDLLNEIFGPNSWNVIGDHDLLQYLPEYLHEIVEFVAFTDAENVEFDNLEGAVQQLLDDQFVATSSLDSIRRRERMLGIKADPTTESLEFRRKRILNRYQTKPPFTVRYLQQQLDNLVGPGMTIVSVDVQNFILYVTANIDDAAVFREVQRTVEAVKPANLVYQQNTSLNSTIGLEEHISKQSITWNYKLDGTWELGEKPFASLGSEEVVK